MRGLALSKGLSCRYACITTKLHFVVPTETEYRGCSSDQSYGFFDIALAGTVMLIVEAFFVSVYFGSSVIGFFNERMGNGGFRSF